MAKVINALRTSLLTSTYGSSLKDWLSAQMGGVNTSNHDTSKIRCSSTGNYAEHGAHVLLCTQHSHRIYLVPVVGGLNNPDNWEPYDVMDNDLVDAGLESEAKVLFSKDGGVRSITARENPGHPKFGKYVRALVDHLKNSNLGCTDLNIRAYINKKALTRGYFIGWNLFVLMGECLSMFYKKNVVGFYNFKNGDCEFCFQSPLKRIYI